jgi:FkbM family methyltransferase
MLLRKLAAYSKEFAYSWTATKDVRSRATLLWQTALFHAMNACRRTATFGGAFTINLEIKRGYRQALHLRPFAGDLFVLYEVLLDNCYYVPDSLLPPDEVRVIVDCGANIGITSLFLASRYPNATIFSIEPHPGNFSILKRNTQAEPRIISVQAAVVGRPAASVRLTSSEPSWGYKLTNDRAGVEVPAITIGELVERYGLRGIDLLKIDIEGAEEMVFARAEFLPWVRLGMIELHGSYSRGKFDADLAKWGFASKSPVPKDGLKMLTFAANVATDQRAQLVPQISEDACQLMENLEQRDIKYGLDALRS